MRIMKPMRVRCALAIAAAFFARLAFANDDYLTWDKIDPIFTRDPARFARLFEQANTETVRIAMFGDSQETSPNGNGRVFLPHVNHGFFQHYGNVPETPLGSNRSYGRGLPPAEYLLAGARAQPGPSSTRLNAFQILPGVDVAAHSSRDRNANINGQVYGQLTMLLPDGEWLEDGPNPTGSKLFDTSEGVTARIYAATNPSSGEVYYQAKPTDRTLPHFFESVTTHGTSNVGLESAELQIRNFETELLDFDGRKYMQLELFGADPERLTDIVGMRYINQANRSGVVVDDFSAGGYRMLHLRDRHSQAGEMLKGLGPYEAIWLHIGTNDAYNNLSPSEFRQEVLGFMNRIRSESWLDDDQVKFILSTDPYRSRGPQVYDPVFDRYPGALYDIALRDLNVLVLNARQITDRAGWSADGDPEKFLADGVHYTSHGGQFLAQTEVSTLLSVKYLPMPGDFDLDGRLDVHDIDSLAAAIRNQTVDKRFDLNRDGEFSVADQQFWVETLAGVGYGDANLDGVFNSVDLTMIFQSHEYEDEIAGNSGWAEGDWNGDGDFNSRDLTLALERGNYRFDAVANVPESNPVELIAFAFIATAMVAIRHSPQYAAN